MTINRDGDTEKLIRVVSLSHGAWQLLCILLFSFIIVASGFSAYRIQKVDQWMRERTEYETSRDAAWNARFRRIDDLLVEWDATFKHMNDHLDRAEARAKAPPTR